MPFVFDISLNDILKSAVFASINGGAVFLSVRYLGKAMDRFEKAEERKSKRARRLNASGKT